LGAQRQWLTVAREGKRHVLGFDEDSIQIWKQTRFFRRCIATYPRSMDGEAEALVFFSTIEPEAIEVPAPGTLLSKMRMTRTGMGAAAAAFLILVLAVVIILVPKDVAPAASAGGADHSSEQAPNAQTGWAYSDSHQAAFLQWTRTGATLSGSLTMTSVDPGATAAKTSTASFTGSIDSDHASLSFSQPFGSISNLAALIQGDNVTLSIPQKDGTLEPWTFRPAVATLYNDAVTVLQQQADRNHQDQVQASAAAADQAARAASQQQADNAVESAARSLASAVSDVVASIGYVKSDLEGVAADLTAQQNDVTTTQHDADAVMKEIGTEAGANGTTCSDAAGVASDASGVDADEAGISGDITSLSSDLDSLRTKLTDLADARDALAQTQKADPSYQTSTPIPSGNEISDATAAAQTVVDNASAVLKSAPAQSAELSRQAHAIADGAAKAGNC
jgi:hypothetical protein